jgi:hypothetical protein
MKRIILIGAFALLAACGSSGNDVSVGTDADDTSSPATDVSTSAADSTETSIEGSDVTIVVSDFSDMPPKCIELLGAFLKKIEPTVSAIDWDKATLAEFEDIGNQFETDSSSFDTELAAAGCDKYNLDPSDENQFEQMAALAAAEAPGTLGFIRFLGSLASSATDDGEAVPTDCDGTIAEIEPFLANGTMQDLTIAEVTRLGKLMTAVGTNCTPEEATAFYGREDVTTFVSG